MPAALEFRAFGLAHPQGGDLLTGVDLEVDARGFYLLIGPSGGGKSSLLRLLAGLVEVRERAPVVRGDLRVLGQPWRRRRETGAEGVVAILQDEGLFDELSPRANVELALRAAGRSRRLAPGLLAQAGLDTPPDRTAQLSGGMRKRLAVARALALRPRLLLCDEPTAGLDAAAARALAHLLREAHDLDPERTTLVVTHDLAAFEGVADGVLVLDPAAKTLRLEAARDRAAAAMSGARAGHPPPTAAQSISGLRHLALQAAAIAETAVESVRRLPPVELGEVGRTALRFATEPAPFVAAAGAVVGGLATFFALRNNPIQGGFETALLTGTGKVATAVLVPMLSGFFFTARIAAGAAARLGTMQRTGQVAALRTMGMRPADHLLTPLVWGMVLAMPLVTLAGVVAASLAAALAARLVAGFSTVGWAVSWFEAVDAGDVLVVLAKASLSGYLVALACYHLGTGPKRSGADVGAAVNTAIVAGMVMVLAVHAVLTFVAYA
ncbi:MAG: ABC transporter permease [Planctomycetes bacterium]|nr:ABC transporter permease [Planctomycetota bacterium]